MGKTSSTLKKTLIGAALVAGVSGTYKVTQPDKTTLAPASQDLVSVATATTGTTSSTIIVTTAAELDSAFRQAERRVVGKIVLANPVATPKGVRVSGKMVNPTLFVDFSGAYIAVTTDTVKSVLYRTPADQTEALNSYQSQSIYFENGGIVGKNGTAVGIEYDAAYGGGVRNMYFNSLSVAARFRFVLMGVMEQNFATNCKDFGFVLDNGRWAGAALSNAQSNHCRRQQNRVFNADGCTAAYACYGASGVIDDQNISEGGRVKYHFYFNAMTSNTCKDYTNRSSHIESPADSAGIKLITYGGIATVEKPFSQYDMTLVDVEDPQGYPHIHVSNIAYVTTGAKFKTKGTNIIWMVDDVVAVPSFTDASRWVGGVKPYYLSVMNYQQSANYTATSLMVNGKAL